MQRVGVAVLSLAILSGYVLKFTPIENEALSWIITLALLAMLLFGAFLLYRGKQYAGRALATSVLDDDRPPVVYLRPFGQDESMAGQVFMALLMVKMYRGFASNEEQLAQAVAPLGPLLAIGQPGERL